ncbi:QueT transporter family protein [Facklamia sp. 7083-14-GEN3]|uniref:QueT transporter family protein n=1 Tax=Facklamia sp. 7083-14-GEN3 TaxID=2973478 RepID=UPI00215CE720|nr:QueT transporter family protein [Facklamia sp. 7083-14-GEN3]MCR8969873.1 QueT transporter family protein [Facklamia sp. 7083-14-GEN3]
MEKKYTTNDLTRIALIAAFYIVLTLIISPLSFGLGIRISEGLNFLALYNKRYILGVTLGVFIVNYFSTYGIWDMVIGSLTSFIFLHLACYIIEKLFPSITNKKDEINKLLFFKYLIIGLSMTISMVNIALLVVFLGAPWESFMTLLLGMMVSEGLSLLVGGIIIYLISERIDLRR